MISLDLKSFSLNLSFDGQIFPKVTSFFKKNDVYLVLSVLFTISIINFITYLHDGLGLSYNDARSHLDIGRRVVEGLKPGLAQLGSVWLPLNHVLMIPTIWNDFMWHSGLAGAIQSMIAFVATGLLIYLFLKRLNVGMLGRLVGVFIWVANLNVLYLQSTAMTELLLIGTMTAGVYYLVLWHMDENILNLILSAFWIMLATLTRYDGWFLLIYAAAIITLNALRKRGYKIAEGTLLFFLALAGTGIVLWILWNLLIFKDPLYFIFGPFSASAQQSQLRTAGALPTYKNIFMSLKVYIYALFFNSYTYPAILGLIGTIFLWLDKRIATPVRISTSALFAPFLFNVIALYFGFSVLFIQGISGNTWFNVRYGIMMAPAIAIFVGYLIDRARSFRLLIIISLIFVLFFALANYDAVTIDDARVGSSQKNVTEVSGWLHNNALKKPGYVLISAASHDAVIFSSGLPMSKFIHEGTGAYWIAATTSPDRWARWIIMRTNDLSDLTFRLVRKSGGLNRFHLVGHYPFADIYELDPKYLSQLHTRPVFTHQK